MDCQCILLHDVTAGVGDGPGGLDQWFPQGLEQQALDTSLVQRQRQRALHVPRMPGAWLGISYDETASNIKDYIVTFEPFETN